MSRYRYHVVGANGFPFDMLRHDCCWPTTSTDAVMMADHRRRVVNLLSDSAPTPGRWESFGWHVIEFLDFGLPRNEEQVFALWCNERNRNTTGIPPGAGA